MIHDILPSDVDLARSLMDSGHSDAEILAQLASRGLDSAKAAALLDDLRHGRKPNAHVPLPPGSDGYRPPRKPRPAAPAAPPPVASPRRQSHRSSHRRGGVPWWFALLALAFIGALVYAFWQAGVHVTGEVINQNKHEIPPPPGK